VGDRRDERKKKRVEIRKRRNVKELESGVRRERLVKGKRFSSIHVGSGKPGNRENIKL